MHINMLQILANLLKKWLYIRPDYTEYLLVNETRNIWNRQSRLEKRVLFEDLFYELLLDISKIKWLPQKGILSIFQDIKGKLSFKERRKIRKYLVSLVYWGISARKNRNKKYTTVQEILRDPIWNLVIEKKIFSDRLMQYFLLARTIGNFLFIDIEVRKGKIVEIAYMPSFGFLPLFDFPLKIQNRKNPENIIKEFEKAVENFPDFGMAGHNVREFDIEKIKQETEKRELFENYIILDTLDLSILTEPFRHSHKLGILAGAMDIVDGSELNFHESDFDVNVNYSIFMKLLGSILDDSENPAWQTFPLPNDWWSNAKDRLWTFSHKKDLVETNEIKIHEKSISIGVNNWHPNPEKILERFINENHGIINLIPFHWIQDYKEFEFRKMLDRYLGLPENLMNWMGQQLSAINDIFVLRRIFNYAKHSQSKHPVLSGYLWNILNNTKNGDINGILSEEIKVIKGKIIEAYSASNSNPGLFIADPYIISKIRHDQKICLWDVDSIWPEFGYRITKFGNAQNEDLKNYFDSDGYMLDLHEREEGEKREYVQRKHNLFRYLKNYTKINDILEELSAQYDEQTEIPSYERFFIYQDYRGATLLDAIPRPFLIPEGTTGVFRGEWNQKFSEEISIYYSFLGFNKFHKNIFSDTENTEKRDNNPVVYVDPMVRIKTEWNHSAFGRDAYGFLIKHYDEKKINVVINDDEEWHRSILQARLDSDKIYVASQIKMSEYWNLTRIAQDLKEKKNSGKLVLYLSSLYGIPEDEMENWKIIMPEGISHAGDPFVSLMKKYAIQRLNLYLQGEKLDDKIIPFFNGNINWLDSSYVVSNYSSLIFLKRRISYTSTSIVFGTKMYQHKKIQDILKSISDKIGLDIIYKKDYEIINNEEKLLSSKEYIELIIKSNLNKQYTDRKLMESHIKEIAKAIYGIDTFRSIDRGGKDQSQPMIDALENKDVLLLAATGTGKSLIYQIPAILLANNEQPMSTLIISPLISLMKDQVDGLHEKKIYSATFINSQLDDDQKKKKLQAYSKGYYSILFLSPEGLSTKRLGYYLEARPPSLVVIDEAHCVSQWGHDFRPDYLRIAQNLRKIAGLEGVDSKDWTTIAVTATAREDNADKLGSTVQDIKQYLDLGSGREFSFYDSTTKRDELLYISKETAKTKEDALNFFNNLDSQLSEKLSTFPSKNNKFWNAVNKWKDGEDKNWPYNQKYLIYCQTKKKIAEVVEELKDKMDPEKFRIAAYHADLPKDERNNIQESYKKTDGGYNLIVATSAFGMGIDVPNIRAVVHLGLPATIEDYYQQAGRAGRDKNPAMCFLIFDRSEFSQKLEKLREAESISMLAFKTWNAMKKDFSKKSEDNEDYETVMIPAFHLAAILGLSQENIDAEISNIFSLLGECHHAGKPLIDGKVNSIPLVYKIRRGAETKYESCDEKEASFILANGEAIQSQKIEQIARKLDEFKPGEIIHPLAVTTSGKKAQEELERIILWLKNKFIDNPYTKNLDGDSIDEEDLWNLFEYSSDSRKNQTERMNYLHEWMLSYSASLRASLKINSKYDIKSQKRFWEIKVKISNRGVQEYFKYIKKLSDQLQSLKAIIYIIPENKEADLFSLVQLIYSEKRISHFISFNLNTLESLIRLLQRFGILEVPTIDISSENYTVRILNAGNLNIWDAIQNAEHIKNKKNLDYFKLDCLYHYGRELNSNPRFDPQQFFEDYFSGVIKTSSLVEMILDKSPVISKRLPWTPLERNIFNARNPILPKAILGTGTRTAIALKIAESIQKDKSVMGRYTILLRNKMDNFQSKLNDRLKEHLGILADGIQITDSWKMSAKIIMQNLQRFADYHEYPVNIIKSENNNFADFLKNWDVHQIFGKIGEKGRYYWSLDKSDSNHDQVKTMLHDFLKSTQGDISANVALLGIATFLLKYDPSVTEALSTDIARYAIVLESSQKYYLDQFLNHFYRIMKKIKNYPDIIVEYSSEELMDENKNQENDKYKKVNAIEKIFKNDMPTDQKRTAALSPIEAPKTYILLKSPFYDENSSEHILDPIKSGKKYTFSMEDFGNEVRKRQVEFGLNKISIQPSLKAEFLRDTELLKFWNIDKIDDFSLLEHARRSMKYIRSNASEKSLHLSFAETKEDFWEIFNQPNDKFLPSGWPNVPDLDFKSLEKLNGHKVFILKSEKNGLENTAQDESGENWKDVQFLNNIKYYGPGDVFYVEEEGERF